MASPARSPFPAKRAAVPVAPVLFRFILVSFSSSYPSDPSAPRIATVLQGYAVKRMAAPSKRSAIPQNSAYERVTTLSLR